MSFIDFCNQSGKNMTAQLVSDATIQSPNGLFLNSIIVLGGILKRILNCFVMK